MSQAGVINTSSGPVPPTVATSYLLDDGNSAVPSANILKVLGGSGTFTSIGDPNQIKVNVINDGFAWSEKNADFPAVVQNGYYCNAALTVTLPDTAGLVIGNTIIIYVDTMSTVTIQANAGQLLQVGSAISTVGGTTSSNTQGALLELNFKPSDFTWHTISSMGSWTTST